MRILKRICTLVMVSMLLVLTGIQTLAASSGDMKIHVLYLAVDKDAGDDEMERSGGDATLLESDGKYLLMDCGAPSTAGDILAYLKKNNIKNIDIYISHMHEDHYGGLETILKSSDVRVGRIYVPYVGIDSAYRSRGENYAKIMEVNITKWAATANVPVTGLYAFKEDMLDTEAAATATYGLSGLATFIQVGKAKVDIIGPVYDIVNSKKPLTVAKFASQDGKSGSKEGHYINNRSLVAKVTCNGMTWITAGDIEVDEEKALVSKYGGGLKADILKLNHHGLGTSSDESFMAKVAPSWSFAQNSCYTDLVEVPGKGQYRKTYSARDLASQYGFVSMVGDEGKDFVLTTSGKAVSMTLGGKALSGWTDVQGADGMNRKTDRYYIGSDGKALTGVQKISGKYYYLGTGGCQEFGHYENGKYNPYRTYGNKIRYYADEKTGEMAVGFTTITDAEKNKNLFYFDKDGFRMESSAKDDYRFEVVTIEGKNYAMKRNGYIWVDGLVPIVSKNNYVYANSKGVLQTGFKQDGKNYYYFDKDGFSLLPEKKNGKYYVVELDGKSYAVKALKKEKSVGKGKKATCYLGYVYTTKGPVTIKGSGSYAYVGSKKYLVSGWQKSKGVEYYYSPTTYLRCGSPTTIKELSTYSSSKVQIKWEKSEKGSGYYIYRATSKDGKYSKIKTITSVGTTSYKDKKAKPGKTYFYKIVPYYSVKVGSKTTKIEGEASEISSIFTKDVSSLKAKAGKKKATLTWKKCSGADGYEIYMATSKNGKYKKVKTVKSVSTTKYTKSSLKKGKTYYFKVRSYKTVNGEKVYSEYSDVKVKVK